MSDIPSRYFASFTTAFLFLFFFFFPCVCEAVFKSKLLQKLYPPAPTPQKEPSPPHITEALAKKTCVRRKVPQDATAAGETEASTLPKQLYDPSTLYTVSIFYPKKKSTYSTVTILRVEV